jgi:hypothetical protein
MSRGDTSEPGDRARTRGGLLGAAKNAKIVKKAETSKPKPAKPNKGKTDKGKDGGTNHGLNVI